jgi:DNA ligase (NAD+)
MNRKTKANLAIALGMLAPMFATSNPQGSFAKRRKKPKVDPATKQTPDTDFSGMSKKQKIDKLVKMLKRYNEAYRLGAPLIQDIEYDELIEILRGLDPKNKWLLEVEPTPPAGRRRVFHNPPMLSTKKAYEAKKVEDYLKKLAKSAKKVGLPYATVAITPKLDGIAIDWSDGVLSTRGETGEYGLEIKNLVEKGLVFIPPSVGKEEFRGELVISRPYFNEHLASERSQPRSFITGLAASKKIEGPKLKALQDGAVQAVSFTGFSEDQSKIFPVTPENIDLIVATIEEIHADLINSVPYDCDGIVLRCTDRAVQDDLGRKGNYWDYMLAFKMRGEKQITTIKSISWSMSRYGILTPIIGFDEVYFDRVTYKDGTTSKGVAMKRASGFNLSLCQRRGYGVGGKIVVLLSGEVIPYISEVLEPSTNIEYPKECPYCQTPTIMKGPALACPNKECVGALGKRIQLFTTLMDMKGFGKVSPKSRGAIVKLVEAGYDRISKILNMSLPDLRTVFAAGTARKLFRSIQKTINTPVDKSTLIRALGIAKIGETKADDLVQAIPNLDVRSMNEIKRQELMSMKGIGGKTADSIKQSLRQMWPQISSIVSHDFTLIEPQKQRVPLQNAKRFLFSGRIEMGKKEIQRATRQAGHIVATNFSDGVDYLVVGSNPGRFKIDKANSLDIPIITEEEFLGEIG